MTGADWLRRLVQRGIDRAVQKNGLHLLEDKAMHVVQKIADGLIDELAAEFPILDVELPVIDAGAKETFRAAFADKLHAVLSAAA